MAKDFIKFITKHPQRERFLDVLEDIYKNNLGAYDIKQLAGHKAMFRLRIGDVRFVFERTTIGNLVHHIGNRGDVYNKL